MRLAPAPRLICSPLEARDALCYLAQWHNDPNDTRSTGATFCASAPPSAHFDGAHYLARLGVFHVRVCDLHEHAESDCPETL